MTKQTTIVVIGALRVNSRHFDKIKMVARLHWTVTETPPLDGVPASVA